MPAFKILLLALLICPTSHAKSFFQYFQSGTGAIGSGNSQTGKGATECTATYKCKETTGVPWQINGTETYRASDGNCAKAIRKNFCGGRTGTKYHICYVTGDGGVSDIIDCNPGQGR